VFRALVLLSGDSGTLRLLPLNPALVLRRFACHQRAPTAVQPALLALLREGGMATRQLTQVSVCGFRHSSQYYLLQRKKPENVAKKMQECFGSCPVLSNLSYPLLKELGASVTKYFAMLGGPLWWFRVAGERSMGTEIALTVLALKKPRLPCRKTAF